MAEETQTNTYVVEELIDDFLKKTTVGADEMVQEDGHINFYRVVNRPAPGLFGKPSQEYELVATFPDSATAYLVDESDYGFQESNDHR